MFLGFELQDALCILSSLRHQILEISEDPSNTRWQHRGDLPQATPYLDARLSETVLDHRLLQRAFWVGRLRFADLPHPMQSAAGVLASSTRRKRSGIAGDCGNDGGKCAYVWSLDTRLPRYWGRGRSLLSTSVLMSYQKAVVGYSNRGLSLPPADEICSTLTVSLLLLWLEDGEERLDE